MNLKTVSRILDKLEAPQAAADTTEADMLAAWADLVSWFTWQGQQTDVSQAFAALPLGHEVRQLQQRLVWYWRHFAPAMPEAVRSRAGLGKLLMETFVNYALTEAGTPPAELKEKKHLDFCLEEISKLLTDDDLWEQYERLHHPCKFKEHPPDEPKTIDEPDEITAEPEPEPPPPPPAPPTESNEPDPPAEVLNGTIRVKYIGGMVGLTVRTVDGLQKVVKGTTYTITPETWLNIQEFGQVKMWEKVK